MRAANRFGITLLEVVIAACILAAAFLPILRVVDFGSVATAKTGHYAKAAQLANQLIEECKFVPFKVYQEVYKDLASGESFAVHEQFYKETKKSIDEFFSNSKDKLKDYKCTANLKAKKNDLNQIVEIWFQVEIFWRDIGFADNDKREKRIVRASNAYFNSEAY